MRSTIFLSTFVGLLIVAKTRPVIFIEARFSIHVTNFS